METLWQFKTRNFTVSLACDYDNEFDPLHDVDDDGETARAIEAGELSAYIFRVEVTHRPTGTVLGDDYLGASVYDDPHKFATEHLGLGADALHIKGKAWNGSYFPDMVAEAIKEARRTLGTLTTSTRTVRTLEVA